MNDVSNVIAERLTTEIVGHTDDYNGGRLSGSTAYGLARLAVTALLSQGYAIVKLPEVTTDEWGDRSVSVPLEKRQRGYLRIEPGGENHKGVELADRIAALGVPLPIEAEDARAFAAALLAAAECIDPT